jgi:2-phosphosulfolactate phosphatase
LRPSLEDWLGAGAILSHLDTTDLSPESVAARTAFEAARAGVPDMIRGCASGRELIERGWAEDVDLAVELDSSESAPFLSGGAFRI